MSMHNEVITLFDQHFSEDYPNVALTNSDVNRIVTAVVQTFNVERSAEEMVKEQISNYIVRYKQRATKRDCGCNKK